MAKDESVQAQPEKEVTDAEAVAKPAVPKEPTFSGEQLIRSATGINRDVMTAALVSDRQYTETDAKKAVDAFLKKEVDHDGGRKLDNSK
ncbi:hypothetical protein [Faecalispora anaeroviscerum]|uniref:hypothetical protein n=1 Tax=Faecalispora anaeroviscerum TaxID=2991836 RepID=UPI0024B879C9|nr:hypothetical protein [Faecalispora anaeroviscerum]